MENFNERTIRLLGEEKFKNVSNLSILLLGLGGVGGIACESLVRLGINNITIVDNDFIAPSNLNRQIISNINNIGQLKTSEFEKRIKSINPNINLDVINMFIDNSNVNKIFNKHYDYCVDCIDSVEAKIAVYKKCIELNIKIISSMGTANKTDPTKLVLTTLNKTTNDKLAKKIRLICRNENIDSKKINVVLSTESPYSENKINPLPSISLVPNSAGILCAYYILADLLKDN